MFRFYSTKKNGGTFDDNTVNAVWAKATIVFGYDSRTIRKDSCGAFIYRSQYGNTNSKYGWEIDHVFPVSLGGSDELSNLQPLQWQNNRHKGDDWPRWSCKITS